MLHPHPSINALLEAEGCVDPVSAIRCRARALVARAFELGWEGPPFDMKELASLRGLRVTSTMTLRGDQDACVVPGQVLVNARKHHVRQRYSVAHEIGHTLFPDYVAEVERNGRLWRRDGDDSEFERLCQIAGAEFLMPLDAFRARQALYESGLRGVVRLAKDFDASIEATARRLVDTTEQAMAAIFLRPFEQNSSGSVPADAGYTPYAALRVSLICANTSLACFESVRGCAPPKGGAADRAWKRASMAHGRVVVEQSINESWIHAGVDGLWNAEAITLPKAAPVPYEVLCLISGGSTEG